MHINMCNSLCHRCVKRKTNWIKNIESIAEVCILVLVLRRPAVAVGVYMHHLHYRKSEPWTDSMTTEKFTDESYRWKALPRRTPTNKLAEKLTFSSWWTVCFFVSCYFNCFFFFFFFLSQLCERPSFVIYYTDRWPEVATDAAVNSHWCLTKMGRFIDFDPPQVQDVPNDPKQW